MAFLSNSTITGNLSQSYYPFSNPSGYIQLVGSGAAPGTNLLSIPVSIDVFGGTSRLLGTPAGWLDVNISGVNRRLAYY